MLKQVAKGVVLMATSAVAIPYTVALLCNLLYGWPQTRDKYKRAFHPRKVYPLNLYILKKLLNLQYLPLLIRWKRFYRKANRDILTKDVPYGRNGRTLDVYTPLRYTHTSSPQAVVIFVYGGGWGKGDKSMYGLLCMEIATKLDVIVCCPNYSIYPQGYVDDMIQDIVHTMSWVHDNIHTYGGDQGKIMLVGHSAGAHLAAMAILELLHDERIQAIRKKQLQFVDQHYAGSNNSNNGSESSESFAVVSDNGEQQTMETSGATSTFEVLNGQQMSGGADAADAASSVGEAGSVPQSMDSSTGRADRSDGPSTAGSSSGQSAGARKGDGGPGGTRDSLEDDEEDDSGDDDSVVTVKPKEIEKHATLANSIQAFVGLAGVYDISDHYEHEASCGIEDVSKMGRAMYGEDHFNRFSPTYIVRNLGQSMHLPKMVLIHGTEDMVVPMSSTITFSEALSENICDVTVRTALGCNHIDLMIDLMEPDRRFYNTVMTTLMETAHEVF